MIIQGLLALTGVAALASAPAPTTAPPPTVPAAVTSTTAAGAASPTTTGATTTVPSGPTTTIPIPAGYTPLIDDSHTIVVAVPGAWQDVNTTAFLPEEGTATEGRPSIVASPDIQKFYVSFDVPGVS